MSEQKAEAPATDLFARKGGARPAGQLIPYENKAEALKRSLAQKTADDDSDETKTATGPSSLLNVIEFRKVAPPQEAGTAPEPTGKSISELSEAVSEILDEPLGAEVSTEAEPAEAGREPKQAPPSDDTKTPPKAESKPTSEAEPDGNEPPKPAQATSPDDTKTPSAAEAKPASEAEPAGGELPKPAQTTSPEDTKTPPAADAKSADAGATKPGQARFPGGAKVPPVVRSTPPPFVHTLPKAPPLGQRAPREQSRGRLALVLLVATGLTMAAWFAMTDSGQDPVGGEVQAPSPAAGTEGTADEATPAPADEANPPETAGAPAADSAEAPADAAVEPSFDLIRIEPDGEAVIAGRAEPGAELILLDNGEPIGRVTADLAGEWAFIPDAALPQGDHQFSLVVAEPHGTVTMPAPKAKPTEDAKEPRETGAPDAEPSGEDSGVLPDAGIGKQSWLREPDGETPILPARKPVLEAIAVGTEAPAIKAGYIVQLSSVVSLDGARQEQEKLQRIFPELLGGMELAVEQAKLDDWSTRYRVTAGGFAEQAPAHALCRELRARRQDCLVVKQ